MAPFGDSTPMQGGMFRFTTAGSVDDGKSTLIGRILYDAKAVPDDQLAALERSAQKRGDGTVDLSLLTDGLTAEREQGITIDVAYRYFATARRKFIIADTPGHEQYTRNMVTGASTADAAVILVDARKGVIEQTRRHLTLAHLLAIPHLLVAINKMDLVGFDEAVFTALSDTIKEFSASLGIATPRIVPLSAKQGDNVVNPSANTPWYKGPTLLSLLEELPPAIHVGQSALRFPVQLVARVREEAGGQKRLYQGRIESGRVSVGDEIVILPAGTSTRVSAISTFDGPLTTAEAPKSISLEVADDVDIARGDLLVHEASRPRVSDRFEATLCWFADEPFDPRGRYLARLGTRTVSARVAELIYRLDVVTQERIEGPAKLNRNDIARVRVILQSPVPYDDYADNRATGAFILIDAQTNATVAAGMIAA
ncbi:MAG TPA: GTP-binding protein [Alphaproteobacteria bacterium]|jgi:sulfate adenylyltransferase large subunit